MGKKISYAERDVVITENSGNGKIVTLLVQEVVALTKMVREKKRELREKDKLIKQLREQLNI